MKRIGILGGMGPQSTSALYLKILDKYFQKYGDQNYPEIVIFSVQFQSILDLQESWDKEKYIIELMKGVQALTKAGADFIVIAANTPHMVLDELAQESSVPLLSIVESAANKAEELSLEKLLLTGTSHTMQSDYYQKVFDKKQIVLQVPTEGHQQQIGNLLIKIDHGEVTPEMKDSFKEVVTSYCVEGVILGCTEFPLLINSADTHVPLLDTLDIFADAILEFGGKEQNAR